MHSEERFPHHYALRFRQHYESHVRHLYAAATAALAAKRVFFRAIRACSEAKSLWVAAFAHPVLRSLMSKAVLTELSELMVEKELRIHVELDDVELPFFSLG